MLACQPSQRRRRVIGWLPSSHYRQGGKVLITPPLLLWCIFKFIHADILLSITNFWRITWTCILFFYYIKIFLTWFLKKIWTFSIIIDFLKLNFISLCFNSASFHVLSISRFLCCSMLERRLDSILKEEERDRPLILPPPDTYRSVTNTWHIYTFKCRYQDMYMTVLLNIVYL